MIWKRWDEAGKSGNNLYISGIKADLYEGSDEMSFSFFYVGIQMII